MSIVDANTRPITTVLVPQQQRRSTEEARDTGLRPFAYDVAIVGLGYVGLPTALAFHAAGSSVLGLDANASRIDAILDEQADLLDSDRDRLTLALSDDDRFELTLDSTRLRAAATVIVCVPTPVDETLVPNLAILRSACETVVANARPGQTIVLTSTTYVGCTEDMVVDPLLAAGLRPGVDVFVAFSPERIDPGNDRHAHEDVPRVIGGYTPACAERAAQALGAYALNRHVVSSTRAAEMTKLLENTFRAVNIALANEVAEVSRRLNLDVMEVIDAASTKPYGFMPFYPGPGVGGHCIPCDPHYLLWQLRSERQTPAVITQAMSAIAHRPMHVAARVKEVLGDEGLAVRGARVLVAGVAYKPDVEDVRESPAVDIMRELLRMGAHISYYDPLIPDVRLGERSLTSVTRPGEEPTDIVLVLTKHSNVDLSWIGDRLLLDATYRLTGFPRRFTP